MEPCLRYAKVVTLNNSHEQSTIYILYMYINAPGRNISIAYFYLFF